MDVIIEVRGGVVQVVYARDPAIKVGVLDWDNFQEEDDPKLIEYYNRMCGEINSKNMTEVY